LPPRSKDAASLADGSVAELREKNPGFLNIKAFAEFQASLEHAASVLNEAELQRTP
jgi:hypothetical protein